MVKNPSANAGDTGNAGSISGSGRSPEEADHNPLQYSCLGSPVDRRAWWATVHGVAKSNWSTYTSIGVLNSKMQSVLFGS